MSSGRDCCLFCGTDSNISTRMGNDRSRSLHVISILHKLLQIPIWECGKYLDFPSPSSSSSPPPGTDWLILCTSCSSMVAHGHDLVQQLDRLQNRLCKIQSTLQNKIANPRKKVMTKTKAKIVDQLKRDISRKTGQDNKSRQSSTKSTLNNLANYSPSEQEESIDDMNLGILVEDVKIEDINLDEEDEIDDLSVEHVAVESDKEEESNFFIESGDEVAANSSDDDWEMNDVRKRKKPKITKITGNTGPRRLKATRKKKSTRISLPKSASNSSSEVQEVTRTNTETEGKGINTKGSKQDDVTFQDELYTIPTEFQDHFTYICTVKGGEEFNRKENGIRGRCVTCTQISTIPAGSYYNWRRHLKMHGIVAQNVAKGGLSVHKSGG
ncbi:uncharacterized protein LOC110861166 [Folsomia candida]|uniref:uncharacterized protein LOC110861166 n=1 Tax=Folsomia candida TaxID=158441 RepID=UPI000B901B28|nr:uncharacterized protein LOC110861166 [Folsomia candida]